jgi:hypothetical protein
MNSNDALQVAIRPVQGWLPTGRRIDGAWWGLENTTVSKFDPTFDHGHMARGGHRLPKVLLGPVLTNLSMPCRGATPETDLQPFPVWPAHRLNGLQPPSTPLDTPHLMPMILTHFGSLWASLVFTPVPDWHISRHRRMAWDVQRGRRWLQGCKAISGVACPQGIKK